MGSLIDAFTPKGKIKSTYVVIIAAIAFAIILLLWSAFTLTGAVDPFFLPPPTDVVKTAISLFTQGDFIKDIGITVFRVMAGFIIAAVVALPLGLMIGTYAPMSAFLEYVVSFVRYLPASAFIPLFILWIGIDEPEKVAVIILGVFHSLF